MTIWSVAVWALLPAMAVPTLFALRGTVASRLIAVQLATGMATLLLLAMSFAFDQSSYTAMAVTLALLGTAGALAFAMALERWL